MDGVLLYGANGYTGRLIARLAGDYGIRPILAGRNRAAIETLAGELGLEHEIFALDDARFPDRPLSRSRVVLHAAGPFSRTSKPMADACIRNGVHYVDITGEIDVFEALHARAAEARAANVLLLPGAGYDVVPSDCLAAHLKRRLPTATHLTLAIAGTGVLSRGTQTTALERMGRGGMIRREGRLTPVPAAWHTRMIDFGDGPRKAVTIPWGDVATSYYSTGIPNVEVYSAPPAQIRRLLRLSRYIGPLMRMNAVRAIVEQRIRSRAAGPSEEELRTGKSYVWGEVVDDDGNFAEARFTGPNGYLLTAHTVLLVAKRILSGDFKVGFQTPSLAYGPDFVLEAPGTRREDYHDQ